MYSCRRFYGTQLVRLVMAGRLSMEEVRRLMGHATTQQLMEYMRAEREKINSLEDCDGRRNIYNAKCFLTSLLEEIPRDDY